jgi:hypothetical protein
VIRDLCVLALCVALFAVTWALVPKHLDVTRDPTPTTTTTEGP